MHDFDQRLVVRVYIGSEYHSLIHFVGIGNESFQDIDGRTLVVDVLGQAEGGTVDAIDEYSLGGCHGEGDVVQVFDEDAAGKDDGGAQDKGKEQLAQTDFDKVMVDMKYQVRDEDESYAYKHSTSDTLQVEERGVAQQELIGMEKVESDDIK